MLRPSSGHVVTEICPEGARTAILFAYFANRKEIRRGGVC
jgi:hypothetical protein